MLPMSQLAVLLALGYEAPDQLDIIEQLSFDGVQNFIVDVNGRRVGLVLGIQEPTDWLDFACRVNWRTDRGDTTEWAAGPLSYAAVVYAFCKGKRLDELAGHSLGSCAAIVGASLGIPTTCFAPMPILHGVCHLDTSWVRNIALADEPLLTIARLGPWLSFLVPPEIVPVRLRVFEPLWPPTWAPAHAIGRYAALVPNRSAFDGEVSAEPAIA